MWWKSIKSKLVFGLFVSTFCLVGKVAVAQTATDFFNRAARSYVKTAKEKALSEVNEGLTKYPNDAKLKALKEKLLRIVQIQRKLFPLH